MSKIIESREKLAELCHKQWSGWIKYMFEKCLKKTNGTMLIPEWAVTRWRRQAYTPYNKLSSQEKDSDCTEADKFITLLKQQPTAKEPHPCNYVNQERAERQPKCKTCGDTGFDPNRSTCREQYIPNVPCPDCQQPKAGEYSKRTVENTEVCPCGNIFVEADDYDTLGSESAVCCPDCGNEKFQTVKARLDRAEAINKDLLEACEYSHTYLLRKIGQATHAVALLEAAIAKAKKGINRDSHREQREAEFRVGEGI